MVHLFVYLCLSWLDHLNARASVLRLVDFMTLHLSNKVFWQYYGSRLVLDPGNVEANKIGGSCLWGARNERKPDARSLDRCSVLRCRAGK